MIGGYLALALILAIFLDRVLEAPLRWRIAGLAATAAALIPLIPTLPISSAQYSIPAFFTDGSAQRLSASGSVLLTPYGDTAPEDDLPEVWEAVSGLAFKTLEGLLYSPGPGGQQAGPEIDPLGQELHELGELGEPAPAALSATTRQTYLHDLQSFDVRSIVVGPSSGDRQVAQLFTELLGSPGVSTGGVIVWFNVNP
jgi:hypothetical protein